MIAQDIVSLDNEPAKGASFPMAEPGAHIDIHIRFSLSVGLAGLTGAPLGSIRFITPSLGAEPPVKAMIVVIFGGLGSLGGTAALIAAVMAAPVVRLKGIYVVLVTLAFSELALQLILSQSQITGDAQGITRIPYLSLGDYRFIRDYKLGYCYLALGLLGLSTLFLLWLASPPFGKSLRAIRDNEDYARARGVSVSRQRMLAMIGSAVFTCIAGGFFAIYPRVASPDVFGFGALSLALSMVLIGGIGTILGPIVAALVLTFATETMAGIRGMEEARFIVVAIGMILVLKVAPSGTIGLLRHLGIERVDRR